tara:strand:+ start:248 stop:580 length:333 start_codon:yes stop_codon:yes gene_type:complete
MTEKTGELDLTLLIEQHQKDIWEYKMKESEWEKTKNQLEGHKKIVLELSINIINLKKEIDNIKIIEESHKKYNGKLQLQVAELKEDNQKLSKQINDHIRNREDTLRKAGM